MPKRKSGPKIYAVAVGREPGLYKDWPSCEAQVNGFPGAKHKSFATVELAQAFLSESNITVLNAAISRKRKVEDEPEEPEKIAKLESVEVVPAELVRSTDVTVVYTDGSSRGNGKVGATAGLGVYFGPDDPRNLAERLPGPRQTNQRAELTAIIRALELVPKSEHVIVKSDSQYSINCFTVWHQKWARSNWRNSSNQDVENKDLVQKGLALVQARQKAGGRTKLEKVAAHVGIHGNEEADRYANDGAMMEAKYTQEPRFSDE